LDVLGLAAAARYVLLELRIIASADVDAGLDDEDHLAPLRAEALAATALAGLDDDRMPLRGARYREWTARAEVTAIVVEAVNLLGDCEQTRRLVLDDGALFPGIPVTEHDLHELVGAVVAQVVLDHLIAAHVLRFPVVERGDDVPRSTSLGHEIER